MKINYKEPAYNIDIVFCIDSTAGMSCFIDIIKERAIHFYEELINYAESKSKHIDNVRIKIVSYRDYLADGENAMMSTDFFSLPEQSFEFSNIVKSIEAFGGGDIPEDGLEALAFCIRSKWNKECSKRRQIIIVWSDAPPHPLGFSSSAQYYPTNIMAKDFAELTDWWQTYMNRSAKRLILYTPKLGDWKDIIENWDNVIHYPITACGGIKDFDYEVIINAL